MIRISSNLASEFLVASQLNRLGLTVALTLGNTKEIDILISNNNNKKFSIDVKGLKNTTNWRVNEPEKPRNDHFFILVCYKNKFSDIDYMPEFYIIPSTEIKELLTNWSGNDTVTCIAYKKLRDNKKYKDAWKYFL